MSSLPIFPSSESKLLGTSENPWDEVHAKKYYDENNNLVIGFSIGDIKWSSADLTQAGFLVANGAEVGRATYPDLCAVYEAMGFPWGAGDGSTTFNLPNLIGKFPEGADSAGGYHEAGLPNIEGEITNSSGYGIFDNRAVYGYITSGAFYKTQTSQTSNYQVANSSACNFGIDASKSNSIYGNSTTVQPPSALLIPYVKAFAGASADSTDLAITELANDVAGKANRSLSNVTENVDFVVDSYSDNDGNWYRVYKSGWVEQGGMYQSDKLFSNFYMNLNFLKPFANTHYDICVTTEGGGGSNAPIGVNYSGFANKTSTGCMAGFSSFTTDYAYAKGFNWYACGMGAE